MVDPSRPASELPPSPAMTVIGDGPSQLVGALIGPYKLIEQIGEGGFGLVFVAEQQKPVKRRVALKIIKPGMDTHDVINRFEAERQALALMDHPNIARVFDAGATASGRPYFVMELVHGIPITDYCDKNRLTLRERLELFVSVCQAVQHAHQKGIIHRDIKPSNVLVTVHDRRPLVKVIDFGVAKALHQPLTDKTIYTRFAQMVGTPLYMSPEQAEMTGLDIDTRSDIYSLGVLLYELLTGTTPFDRKRLSQAAYDELIRIIRDEEPPRPSTRLSRSTETLSAVAAQRKTEPARLSRMFRGDLDWITMKALEKDRTRRYETANGLARDIERYLNDEPVEAGPPGAGYRLRKFARKNRMPLRIAGVFLMFLVSAAVLSTWQAVRATVAEKAADDRKREADEAKDQAEKQRDELANLNQALRRANYIGDMNLAQQAWEANNLVRTRQLVEQHVPKPGEGDLRSFEWYYLQRLLHSDRLTIDAHAGYVSGVAFTPDGRRLFSAGKSRPIRAMESSRGIPGEIKLWNAATGEALSLALDAPSGKVANPALSADGTRLAAACGIDGIQVWNVLTGQRFDLKSRAREIYAAVAFSPDGKRLVSLSVPEADGHADSWWAKIWDLQRRQEIVGLDKNSFGSGGSPVFSPDGKSVAIVRDVDRSVRVIDAATARELFSVKSGEGFMLHAVFSPDGKSLATCGQSGPIIWDVTSHQKRIACQSAALIVNRLAYRPDGKQLASASMQGLIEIWNATSGQKTAAFMGPAGGIHMAFSPDGTSLASAGNDGTIRIWDTSEGHDAVAIFANSANVGSVDLSPDARTLLWESLEDKRWHFADPITGAPRGEPIEIDEQINECFGWTADGTRLVAPVRGNKIVIYDGSTGSTVRSWQLDRDKVGIAAFTPAGEAFAYSAPGGKIRILNAQTGAERLTLEGLTGQVHNLAFSSDGSHLAAADRTGRVVVWESTGGREIASAQIGQMQMLRIRFSLDGKRLGIAGNSMRLVSGEARILDLASGQVTELLGHTLLVNDIAFSADGQRVATGSSDRTVRIWDAGTGTGMEILTLHGHTQAIQSVRFLSNGHRLISGSSDGTVRVWDGTPLSGVRQ
jgi:WD40 repeat protein/serine/threonine protein kinase